MTGAVTMTMQFRFAWWVKPYLAFWSLMERLGLPVSGRRISARVMRGIKIVEVSQ